MTCHVPTGSCTRTWHELDLCLGVWSIVAVCQVTCNCKISELQRTSPSELKRSGYRLHFQLRAGNKTILKFEKVVLIFLLFFWLFWWYDALEWRKHQVKDPLRSIRLIRMFRGRPSTSKSKKRKKKKKTYYYKPGKPNCKHSRDLCTRLQGIWTLTGAS